MKSTDVGIVKQLTHKLEIQGDITLEEADRIFSLFSEHSQKTRLNPYSRHFDKELETALIEWFYAVNFSVEKELRGNFIFTLPVMNNPRNALHMVQMDVWNTIKKHGRFEDFFSEMLVDQKIHSSLPEEFQKLFVENWISPKDPQCESYYVLKSPRAGFYHYPMEELKNAEFNTLSQFMKKFSSVMVFHNDKEFFEKVAGAREIYENFWVSNSREIHKEIIAAYIRYKNLPCIAMVANNVKTAPIGVGNKYILFTEKDKVPTVKSALEVPVEDIIKHALNNNVIDKATAQNILSGKPPYLLFAMEFIETNVKYVDEIVRMKMRWKNERQETDEWLEETR